MKIVTERTKAPNFAWRYNFKVKNKKISAATAIYLICELWALNHSHLRGNIHIIFTQAKKKQTIVLTFHLGVKSDKKLAATTIHLRVEM